MMHAAQCVSSPVCALPLTLLFLFCVSSAAIKFCQSTDTKLGDVGLTVSAQPVAGVAPLSARLSSDPSRGGGAGGLGSGSSSVTTISTHSSALYELTFHVKDNGIGISASDMSKLFQSFSQAKHISSKYGGTGLGLVISKRLAEAMGGRIWCTSELGVGSTFSFSIQVEVQESSSAHAGSSPQVPNQADVPMWPPSITAVEAAAVAGSSSATGSTGVGAAAATLAHGGNRDNPITPFEPTLPFDLTQSVVPCLPSACTTLAASTSSSLPPSSFPSSRLRHNPHDLSDEDCAMLANSTILLLGKRVGSVQVWANLLLSYGARVHTETSASAALMYISEHHHSPQRVSLFALEGFDSWSLSTGSADAADCALEEPIEEQLDPVLLQNILGFAPLSLLFLTDRYYHQNSAKNTPLSLVRSLAPSSSSPSLGSSSGSGSSSSSLGLRPALPSSITSERISSDAQVLSARTAADKLLSAGEAAVAKLQTRSPALMGRRLGRKESAKEHPSHLNSSPGSNGGSSSNGSSSSHASPATHSNSKLISAELSMPFKHRDWLIACLRQLYRLKDVIAGAAPTALLTLPPTSAASLVSPTLPASEGLSSRSTSASNPVPEQLIATAQVSTNSAVLGQAAAARQVGYKSASSPRAPSSALAAGGAGGRAQLKSGTRPHVPIALIAKTHPLKILLAEDNLINQKLMVMMLRKLGYEISVACNGRECLEVLEREAVKGPQSEIDVILMDASMDVMGGEECTRVIRAQQLPTRKRPFIIAQTANVSDAFKKRCLESGMDFYLSKPVNLDSLVGALKAAHHMMMQAQQQTQTQTQTQQPAAVGGAGAVAGPAVAAEVAPMTHGDDAPAAT